MPQQLPSQMTLTKFTETFQHIYELTPSIPKSAHPSLTSTHDTPSALHKLLSGSFNALPELERLAILRRHPRLADKTATPSSSEEQASSGLSALSSDVKARFDDLNQQYYARFGWPFIIPVKDYPVDQILHTLQTRLESQSEQEFQEACRCVNRIAEIRLLTWFQEHHPEQCA